MTYHYDALLHKFTSKERDSESGLDYAFARYYSPRLGRFLSTDPLGGAVADLQSHNGYAYVSNDPQNAIDPAGMNECAPGEHDCNWGLGEGNPGQDVLGGDPGEPLCFVLGCSPWDGSTSVGLGESLN